VHPRNPRRLQTRSQFVALALALAFTTSGCSWFHKRKPQTVTPQAQAPTVAAPAPAPPTENPKPAEPEPQPTPPASQTTAPKSKPKPTRAKKTPPATTPPANTTPAQKPVEQASATPPPRIVIQEAGGTAPANQVTANMPHDEATDRQRTTQQLLDSTDANLRGLTRNLSADERAMVDQIKAYQQQARDAGKDGDLVRAHNLALKAHLLSDELVKR
jgi:outer membrane biosynthesis protein TonB